jgi:hypothetical protein
MSTTVAFYTEPTNLDYLMTDARVQFGDIDGSIFSDTIIRTALISGVRFLQRKWNGKYQIYVEAMKVTPQPDNVPAGYIRINSLHGLADIPSTVVEGSIFRDPYAEFTQTEPLLIESIDEQAIILAAVYILRKAQVSSNVGDFLSWKTEDIGYNNLGVERGLSRLLEQDLNTLNEYLQSRIAKPRRVEFPITYIPTLTEVI